MGARSVDKKEIRLTFMAWEKLRPWYNVVLLVMAGIVAVSRREVLVADAEFYLNAGIRWLFLANLAFFLGPAVESYIGWLGHRSRAIRMALFLFGLLYATRAAMVATAGATMMATLASGGAPP